MKRLPDGELLAVVAHGLKPGDAPLEIYRQRRGIELCFACLKTKGFTIEDTHLRQADRLEKLFALASIALASIAAAAALRASVERPDKPAGKASSRKKTPATPPVRLFSAA